MVGDLGGFLKYNTRAINGEYRPPIVGRASSPKSILKSVHAHSRKRSSLSRTVFSPFVENASPDKSEKTNRIAK